MDDVRAKPKFRDGFKAHCSLCTGGPRKAGTCSVTGNDMYVCVGSIAKELQNEYRRFEEYALKHRTLPPTKLQEYAEDCQIGLEGVELLDDNDLGFQVRSLTVFVRRTCSRLSKYASRCCRPRPSLHNRRSFGSAVLAHLSPPPLLSQPRRSMLTRWVIHELNRLLLFRPRNASR